MTKLLRAGFRRYFRSILFWICLCLSIGIGLFIGYNSRKNTSFEPFNYMLPIIISAVLVSLGIGREFSDGIFRCKIAAGYSKGQIFLSETVISLSITFIFQLFTSVCFAIFNLDVFKEINIKILAFIWIGVILTTITFTAFFVFISCSVSKKAIASIINILLVISICYSGFELAESLGQPEYHQGVTFEYNEETGERVPIFTEDPNPKYIGGELRTVLETVADISPYGQFLNYRKVFDPMLQLCFVYDGNVAFDDHRFDEYIISGSYTPDQEDLQALTWLPLYQLSVIALLLGGGYFIFRKKDFK